MVAKDARRCAPCDVAILYSSVERRISIIWQNCTSIGGSLRFIRLFPLQIILGIAVLTALLTVESPLSVLLKETFCFISSIFFHRMQNIRVDVYSYIKVFMAQGVLDHLEVYSHTPEQC